MMKLLQGVFPFVLVFLLSLPAEARTKEPHCTWKGVTEERLDESDAALLIAEDPQVPELVKRHLPFGMPVKSGDEAGERLLAQEHYLIWYDVDLRAPLWTAHRLTKSEISVTRKRADSFRSDPRLGAGERSECADYKEPIFDQGHMVPNGDMTRSDAAMDQTFLMSNMSPQHCAFNRGVWQVLESRIRTWALEADADVWVITGSIFDREPPLGRDADADAWRMNGGKGRRVAIPSAQYKIVVRGSPGGYQALSILMPNNDTVHAKTKIPKYIAGHVTTLGGLAQQSGFRFLQGAQVTEVPTLWPSKKAWAGPLTAACKANYPDK